MANAPIMMMRWINWRKGFVIRMDTTQAKIRTFIVENFLFGEDGGLKNDSSFLDSGIIDSTGILELVDFLESEFSIDVEDEELIPENLDSLNNLDSYLSRKLNS